MNEQIQLEKEKKEEDWHSVSLWLKEKAHLGKDTLESSNHMPEIISRCWLQ